MERGAQPQLQPPQHNRQEGGPRVVDEDGRTDERDEVGDEVDGAEEDVFAERFKIRRQGQGPATLAAAAVVVLE